MNINQVPVILHSMDSYSRFWNPWYFLFKKHCKNHGPIYFLSEEKEPDFVSEINHVKTGKGEWGYRLLKALEEIDSELVFYMQEDFWCVRDFELEDSLIKLFNKYNMDQLHIKENTAAIKTTLVEQNVFKFDQNSPYTQNHQFGLWKKTKLIENVFPHENPWENEIAGTKRLNKTQHNVYLYDFRWYRSVCRKGELKDMGKKILSDYNLNF